MEGRGALLSLISFSLAFSLEDERNRCPLGLRSNLEEDSVLVDRDGRVLVDRGMFDA